eukprot:TRINITY_DN93026_c0_g1_i1.p1 TRINITY_DN93026_c0_g1~~TRINITY_DN93026_c0_g1_i1.p1  ORF type:complete len:392 (+),score=63.35 TRINITY_DN93026_c0_g1_i1:102-1277(+)
MEASEVELFLSDALAFEAWCLEDLDRAAFPSLTRDGGTAAMIPTFVFFPDWKSRLGVEGHSALHLAAYHGLGNIAWEIIHRIPEEPGQDWQWTGLQPVVFALFQGHTALVRALTSPEAQARQIWTLPSPSPSFRLLDVVQKSIQLAKTDDCAEVFVNAVIERLSEEGTLATIIEQDEDYDSDSLLMAATRLNFSRTLTCLAHAGWSVDVYDHISQFPIHEAVQSADQAALALIQLGADVNATDGEWGESVMTKALQHLQAGGMTGSFPQVLVELLRAGSRPEFPDGGSCLLECIRRSGDTDLATRIAPLATPSSVVQVCTAALDGSEWAMAVALSHGRPDALREASVMSLTCHPGSDRLEHLVTRLGVALREEDLEAIASATAISATSATT